LNYHLAQFSGTTTLDSLKSKCRISYIHNQWQVCWQVLNVNKEIYIWQMKLLL